MAAETTKVAKKVLNTKPTLRQRRAVEEMVTNGGVITRAMRAVGYSPITAENPKKLTESKGFKALMAECGLTESFISKALVEDIAKKPQARVRELELGAKILKMTNPDNEQATVNNFTFNWGADSEREQGHYNPVYTETLPVSNTPEPKEMERDSSASEIRQDDPSSERRTEEMHSDEAEQSTSGVHSPNVQDGEKHSVGLPEALQ